MDAQCRSSSVTDGSEDSLDRGYGKAAQPIVNPGGGALVNVTIGSEPIRTAEQLQALYSAAMRDPDLDVSNIQIELQPTREAIEHQGNHLDPETRSAVPKANTKDISDEK